MSVSPGRSQSHSRSPASKLKSDNQKKSSSLQRGNHQNDSRHECSDSHRDNWQSPYQSRRDQEADPSPDIKEVTPSTEGTQEVLLIHILLEGITQAEGPDHDPDPDLGPGPGLTEEGQGLIPTIINQGQSLGPDPGPGEDTVTVPKAVMVPDLQTASAQDGTPSPCKVNIELDRLSQSF